MAKDHGLCDCDCAVDVTQRVKLVLSVSAEHVILLDGVQGLLLSLQSDNVGIRDDALGKLPHCVLEGCREEQHLTVFGQLPARQRNGSRDLVSSDAYLLLGSTYISQNVQSCFWLLVSPAGHVAHLWMRMLWSWWPCMPIMTSASSSTNTRTFLGSITFFLVNQSDMVPGVPITICSWILLPPSTEERHRKLYALPLNSIIQISHCTTGGRTEFSYFYCLEWRMPISPQGRTCPSAPRLYLSVGRAHRLETGTDTAGDTTRHQNVQLTHLHMIHAVILISQFSKTGPIITQTMSEGSSTCLEESTKMSYSVYLI